ncbi:MAG: metallophosphoesterase [Candidatus Nanoarchaeia archaeon]|nr:metallophosphoesterase [Candidatus Nanoarchaeia archaeon]
MEIIKYLEEQLDSKNYLYGNLNSFVELIESLSIDLIDMDYLQQNFDEENHKFYFNEGIINEKDFLNYYQIDFISKLLKITLIDIIINLIENYKEKSESEDIEFFYIDSFILTLFYNKFIEKLVEESLTNKDFEKKIYVKYKSNFKKRISFYLTTVEETISKHPKKEIQIFRHLYDIDDKCFFDMLINFFIKFSKKNKNAKTIKINKDTITFKQKKEKFFKTMKNDIVFLPFLNYIIDRTSNNIIIKSINWEKYSQIQLSLDKEKIKDFMQETISKLDLNLNIEEVIDELIKTNKKANENKIKKNQKKSEKLQKESLENSDSDSDSDFSDFNENIENIENNKRNEKNKNKNNNNNEEVVLSIDDLEEYFNEKDIKKIYNENNENNEDNQQNKENQENEENKKYEEYEKNKKEKFQEVNNYNNDNNNNNDNKINNKNIDNKNIDNNNNNNNFLSDDEKLNQKINQNKNNDLEIFKGNINENIIEKIKKRYQLFNNSIYEKLIINKDNKINQPDILTINNINFSFKKDLTPRDFIDHFRNRYDVFYEKLSKNKDLKNIYTINRVKTIDLGDVSIVAMISDFHLSKKGNLVYTLEDKTDNIKAVISNNLSKDFDVRKIFLDDICGFSGHFDKNIKLFIIDKIIINQIEKNKLNSLTTNSLITFASDLHIGNKNTNYEDIKNFFKFLNGKTKSEKLNKLGLSIDYLFLGGDLIDGIGNYPKQENDLEIKNIYNQIDYLYEILKSLRKDLNIILAPGNHDTSILEEPQPILPLKYYKKLYSLENVSFTTNPSFIEIKDNKENMIKIFYYHGGSFLKYLKEDYYYNIKNEEKRFKEFLIDLLNKGHLAMQYGSTYSYINSEKDYLFIPEDIDIFYTAHLHKTILERYNNIDIINSGSWIRETDYQKLNDFVPDVNKFIICNLKTRKNMLIDFDKYKNFF